MQPNSPSDLTGNLVDGGDPKLSPTNVTTTVASDNMTSPLPDPQSSMPVHPSASASLIAALAAPPTSTTPFVSASTDCMVTTPAPTAPSVIAPAAPPASSDHTAVTSTSVSETEPIQSVGLADAPTKGCSGLEANESHVPFSPQGAWKKALSTTKLMNCQERCPDLLEDVSSPSQWPSLSVGQKLTKRQMREKSKNKVIMDDKSLGDINCSKRIEDNVAQRFPWAAKMNPTSRNLYRATSPTYMDDGTPKVQIPNHVLLQGLENQKEFIIGQFYRCSTPSPGLIYAVVNMIWGRRCKIFIRKLGESSYMFHIPDESTRAWVLQRGLWHIDDCLMFVAPWTPTTTLALPEISTIPVWVTLKNIPSQLYSIQGISWIASGLGAPMSTNKPRLDPTLMGEAKILVEVELDKPFPQNIAAEDMTGTVSMIDVEYSWLPSKCRRCGQLGHKESRCLQKPLTASLPQKIINDEVLITVPEIDIEETPPNTTTIEAVTPTLEATSILEEASHCQTITRVHHAAIAVADATNIVEVNTSSEFTSTSALPPLDDTSLQGMILESLGTNLFAAREGVSQQDMVVTPSSHLGSLNDDGALSTPETSDTDVDFVTTSSQRILRDRPVQPTLKYNDNEWISVSTCRRGKRSRGGRRGRVG